MTRLGGLTGWWRMGRLADIAPVEVTVLHKNSSTALAHVSAWALLCAVYLEGSGKADIRREPHFRQREGRFPESGFPVIPLLDLI